MVSDAVDCSIAPGRLPSRGFPPAQASPGQRAAAARGQSSAGKLARGMDLLRLASPQTFNLKLAGFQRCQGSLSLSDCLSLLRCSQRAAGPRRGLSHSLAARHGAQCPVTQAALRLALSPYYHRSP